MIPQPFHVFDTTLRDGSQQEGLRLSVNDKLRVAGLLDDLGVTFIEGGWPGANPNDTEFFAVAQERLHLKKATLVAFGATRRVGLTAATDPLTAALVEAGTDVVCLVAKSHDRHVTEALKTTLDENLAMIDDTVTYLRGLGKRVFVDCEHFFNGYIDNPSYALDVVKTSIDAGAEVAVLCDTNGGMLPSRVHEIVSLVVATGAPVGVHCHNDTGCAVANTIAGVEAGAMHIQGTINGYGERTGNADLITLIGDLQLKWDWPLVTPEALQQLTHVSHTIAEIVNQPPAARQPYAGSSSFAHKAGLHASAIKVDPDLYQHIDPAIVGNDMRMLISDMAGRASIQIKAEQLGHDLSDRQLASRLADLVKRREAQGYSYEAADASFDLLVRDALAGDEPVEKPFSVATWRVFTDHEEISEAVVRVGFGDDTAHPFVGEGNGPVNALDEALRQALSPRYHEVREFELTDYRVRLLGDGLGTDATTRVLIDTRWEGLSWTTVGVGGNVIEASWEALVDAFTYGLTVIVPGAPTVGDHAFDGGHGQGDRQGVTV
ncbi:MAG: citramalate synthase [Propionibacteriaceae bacterium]|jgi:2-isopropylmalate synthase|nr:citramalate synthase [Propionibacteriaceae bacterium]